MAASTLSTLQLCSLPNYLSSKPSKSRFSSLARSGGKPNSVPVVCSSNGRPQRSDGGVKRVDRLLEEKRWEELSSRIASGEFTVRRSGRFSELRKTLEKFGGPGRFLGDVVLKLIDNDSGIPEASGSIKSISSQPFFIPLYRLFLTYGGIFRLLFGPKSFIIVSDPAIAKHILRDNAKSYSKGILAEVLDFVMGKGLIPADGEIWRVRRRAIVPALHKKYVEAMISLFAQASDRLCQKLDAAAQNGKNVEMESFFSKLTLDIIGKAVFNYDFDSLTNDTGIVEAVYTVLRESENRSVAVVPYWKIPIWKDVSPYLRKVTAALMLINDTLDDLIAICKRMVENEETKFHEEYMNEQDPSILHFLLASGDDVSSKQLRDDLMTMLIAGHETSAAVLTWTFYLLSKEPNVMTKLQTEVDCVLGDHFPTIEDIQNLKYTARVINESMRLYPQPPVLIRRALEDDVIGDYRIKRGEDIFVSVWNLHRSPDIWVEAEKFNPERWPLDGPNPNEVNQNFSYLPFGGGPRKCIGEVFASYEVIVAVAMLVRKFNFEMAPGAPPVEMTTGATIHTTEGLKMTVTRRPKPPAIPSLEVRTLTVDPELTGVPRADKPASVG